MPRIAALVALLALAACAYDPGPVRPGVSGLSGITGPAGGTAPGATAPTGATAASPTFSAENCPVDDDAFCERAAFLANALVLGDTDAVEALFVRQRYDCRTLDEVRFPQCAEDPAFAGNGALLGTYQDEFFVLPPKELADALSFFVTSVDPDYEDELGGSAMRILGVSTCGSGRDTSYHVVYLVGLKDPESTLPGDRFLGTYGFERDGDAWRIGVMTYGLYTDWQLVLDDPLAEIACGDLAPWEP